MTYDEEQYRADMEGAYQEFPWVMRPLIRFAVWLVEIEEGTPAAPGLRGWWGKGKPKP